MSDNTPAQTEATGAETVEFEHFDRKWHVPAKTRFSHQVSLRRDPSNTGIVLTFLPQEEVDALLEIDPDDDALDAFTDAIVAALGMKGNS